MNKDLSSLTPDQAKLLLHALRSGVSIPEAAIQLGFKPNARVIKREAKAMRDEGKLDGVAPVTGERIGNVTVLSGEAEEPNGVGGLIEHENYVYNPQSDTYITFMRRGKAVLTGIDHRAMLKAYSNWDGDKQTINQICRTFRRTRDWFDEYRRLHGWTHDHEPITREEMLARNPDDIVDELYQERRNSIHQEFAKRSWAETEADAQRWRNLEASVLTPMLSALESTSVKLVIPKLRTMKRPGSAAILSVLQDWHYGKYDKDYRGRSVYNRAIAAQRAETATKDLLNMTLAHGQPDKIIAIVGSDDLHVDGAGLTTTAGTPQGPQSDGPFPAMFEGYIQNLLKVVGLMRQVAPVELVVVPGNHNRVSAMLTGVLLEQIFRGNRDVTVTRSQDPRVYSEFGDTGIVYTHGDHVKAQAKGIHKLIMAEARKSGVKRQKDQWVLVSGHRHTMHTGDLGGVMWLETPALSGDDDWHKDNEYVGNRKMAASYLIDKRDGLFATLLSEGIFLR
jgi:predicted phosphodiesterase